MEKTKSRVGSLLMVFIVMVLGVLVGQSTASFLSCYEDCYVDCIYKKPGQSPASCMKQCVEQCPGSLGTLRNAQYYCNVGCAYSACANISLKENPEKVKDCVASCSNTCNKKI